VKIKFDSNQDFQLDAIRAVVDVFVGQPLTQASLQWQSDALGGDLLTEMGVGNSLVLGDEGGALSSIGQADHWLNVRTPSGYSGYVAAWLVQQASSTTPVSTTSSGGFSVYPTADINIRAQASLNSPRTSGALRNEALQVVEPDLEGARQKIGMPERWVFVQTAGGKRGFVAAYYLSPVPV